MTEKKKWSGEYRYITKFDELVKQLVNISIANPTSLVLE